MGEHQRKRKFTQVVEWRRVRRRLCYRKRTHDQFQSFFVYLFDRYQGAKDALSINRILVDEITCMRLAHFPPNVVGRAEAVVGRDRSKTFAIAQANFQYHLLVPVAILFHTNVVLQRVCP